MYKTICSLLFLSLTPSAGAQNKAWTLSQCINHAIEHNITIKQQEINVQTNEISLSSARLKRLPGASASMGQNFSFGRGLTANNTYANTNTGNTSFSLGAELPLWDGGQMEHQVKLQRLNVEAAMADLRQARENIRLQVLGAYLDVLYQKELTEINRRQLLLSENQAGRIQKIVENGKMAESDLAEAQANVANDKLNLTQQENAQQLSLLELSQLLELSSVEGFDIAAPDGQPTLQPEASPEDIYNQALVAWPQVEAERLRLKGAERNVQLTRSAYYPNVSLNGGLGTNYYYTSSGHSTDSFSKQLKNNFSQYVGVSLNIPLFQRLQTRNQVRQARLQVQNQKMQLEHVEKRLYKEIQQAYYNAVAAARQYQSSETALRSAQASYKLIEKKYENGKANATEYAEAKTRLMRAESNLSSAKYTALLRNKILNYYRGLGVE